MAMSSTSFVFSSHRRRMRGFTLTEIVIVLGIIGFILGAIWTASGMVYENNRTKQASTQMLGIVNNWKAIFGSKKVDIANSTDMTQLTVNNGFATSDMVPPPGTVGGCVSGGSAATCFAMGPWSGSEVNVVSYQNDNGIGVQYSRLSQKACNRLGNAIAGVSSLISLSINGGSAAKFPPLGTDTVYTSSDIASKCANITLTNSILAEFSMN